MKQFFLALALLHLTFFGFSQQPDIAHVIAQPLELNPAYAGSYNQYRLDLLKQEQWITYDDHPERFKVSVDIPIQKANSGIGTFFSQNENGPFNTTSFNLNYSYAFKLKFVTIQVGTGFNLERTKIESSVWIVPAEYPDPLLEEYEIDALRLSMVGGVFVYNKQFYFSFAYHDFALYNNDDRINYNSNSIYLMGGYHFFKGKVVSFCPSYFLRINPDFQNSTFINMKLFFANMIWLSSSYYSEDYLELGVGINIWKCHGGIRYSNRFSPAKDFTNLDYGLFQITTGFYFD